ncbi:hypothetical protein GCM10009789_12520 [Kribbella sancticallisti]|uniref:Uncharacterized protein n=1 Tax=Kribbella sancticallisti TaxID=460087 RepID=A0ABP4NEW4_9ACTN
MPSATRDTPTTEAAVTIIKSLLCCVDCLTVFATAISVTDPQSIPAGLADGRHALVRVRLQWSACEQLAEPHGVHPVGMDDLAIPAPLSADATATEQTATARCAPGHSFAH